MPTGYVRQVNLKDSLSDAEVVAYWRLLMEEVLPAMQRVSGVRSAKAYSGAGGLRADLRLVLEQDDAGVYKRLLATLQLQPLITKTYSHARRTKVGRGHLSGYSIAASELLGQFVDHRPGGYASLTIIAFYESPGYQ